MYSSSPKQACWTHTYHGQPGPSITQKDGPFYDRSVRQEVGKPLLFKLGAMDRSGFATFMVNHFNGPVTYLLEGFLECSLDALNLEFVAPIWGTSSTPSNVH